MSLESVTEYALAFGGDAVHLQSRPKGAVTDTGLGWLRLGSVDFEDAGFRDSLIQLRQMATGLPDEAELPVTLIIPDDQILYTTLTVAPSADRQYAVGRALDGLTPYPIEDLSFDWDGDGDNVRVAAVARQTLREARQFAAQYGFRGEAYRAAPEDDVFPGEPIFVLDLPVRARPVVDPAGASVTASELMIQDDADAKPAQAAANPEDLELPPELPATDATGQPGQDATDPQDQPQSDAASAAVVDAAKLPPVVRHPPVAPNGAPDVAAMNPRARAVHERAAEARQTRSAGAAPAAPQRAPAGYRGGLTGLVGMLAALIVGLVLIWAFVVPGDPVGQVVAQATQTEQVPPEQPAATDAPSPLPPAVPVASPAPADTVTDEAPDAPVPAPAPQPAPEAVPVAEPPAAPAAVAPPVAALTEAEARRVVVAAAAVAAAVVPPRGARPAEMVLPETPAVTPPVAETPAAPASPAQVAATPAAPGHATGQSRPSAAAPESAPVSQRAAPAAAGSRTRPATPAVQHRTATPSLSSSARPQLAPRRSTPQRSTPRTDAAPVVPANPLPYAASQSTVQPQSSARPPSRSRPAVQPAAAPQAVQAENATTPSPASTADRGSSRPPQRPEGSAPDAIWSEDQGAALLPAEQQQLNALIRDLGRLGLVPGAGPQGDIAAGDRLAQARPVPRPANAAASDAVSASAVQSALRSATEAPPDRPAAARTQAAAPARDSGGLLRGSPRPSARPAAAGRAALVSDAAVEQAIAAAVDASPAPPGGVQLSALRSSPLPPRRADAPSEPAPAAPDSPATPAAPAQSTGEAEIAARRALDEQLQSQAEARIRARAQADAAAEAQSRAQAEARARAQAAAEERQARARQQVYKPPEVDDEPEIAGTALRGGVTTASVAKSATQSRGMNTSRTTIIGIIGAGDASRALIRLRNGKIVTVRMGDRIDGGTINSIGDGRLTYVKSGQVRELRMLDGR